MWLWSIVCILQKKQTWICCAWITSGLSCARAWTHERRMYNFCLVCLCVFTFFTTGWPLNSWRAVAFHIWSLSQRPRRLSQNMDCHYESDVWRLGTSWHVVQHLCWTWEGGEGISGTCASPGDGDITKPQGQGSTKTHRARSKTWPPLSEQFSKAKYVFSTSTILHQSPK